MSSDTIAALATAPGKSGVAVVRVSGPRAFDALKELAAKKPADRRMQPVRLRDPQTGALIDSGLAVAFKGPASFTGEDVVEFHTHGSLSVIRALMEALTGMEGIRPAEPGEFTRRAYLNGKMDLLEAEGLADLIDAQTQHQQAQALRQMGGGLSQYYQGLRAQIIECLAHLEAYIDFPEEEIPESVLAGLAHRIESLQEDIRRTLGDGRRGERLREGLEVVILGAPNAGKSSLLNALAGREAAIVSTRAGTTRDVIEIHMGISGFPVILADTAGLRDSLDDIEAEGIRRAYQRAQSADVKLILFDGEFWPDKDKVTYSLIDETALVAVSKSDLVPHEARQDGMLFLSTKTGEGIEPLLNALEERLSGFFSTDAAPMITRERHRALLSDALDYLEKSKPDKALELKCEDLRQAALAIGKITGKIQIDDVLDVIFRSFCIGK